MNISNNIRIIVPVCCMLIVFALLAFKTIEHTSKKEAKETNCTEQTSEFINSDVLI